MRNALIKVAFVSLVVGTLVALFLAFTISRPLRRLTEAAGRIAAGERGVALNLGGRDEIGELARDFDAMARALDARLGYISELAANVSHEFKTPIASMRGAAELLRDGAADDPEARNRFLGNILEDAERLSRLVTRLLELSRIESRPEARVPLEYRALVASVVARYPSATLVWNAAFEHLRAAPDQVETVLTNLLDNAARFSPAGAPHYGARRGRRPRVSHDGARRGGGRLGGQPRPRVGPLLHHRARHRRNGPGARHRARHRRVARRKRGRRGARGRRERVLVHAPAEIVGCDRVRAPRGVGDRFERAD